MSVQPHARMPLAHHHERCDETIYGLVTVTTLRIAGVDRRSEANRSGSRLPAPRVRHPGRYQPTSRRALRKGTPESPADRFAARHCLVEGPQAATMSQTAIRQAAREEDVDQPGLDARHRDLDGQIIKKHGNTLVSTLRKIYGQRFLQGFAKDRDKLSTVLAKADEPSLHQLRGDMSKLYADHEAGSLAEKIKAAQIPVL